MDFTGINNELMMILVASVGLVFAFLGGYMGMKLQLRVEKRLIKALEDDVEALTERFNRRQNRESMREARAAKAEEKALLERAQLAAATEGNQVAPPAATDKTSLRRKILGRH